MSKIWVTSDLHLCHDRDFLWGPRGFKDVKEHDKTVIANINKLVGKEDTLYVLGDMMLNDNERGMYWLKQIACADIRVALGNHDSESRIDLYKTAWNVKDVQFAYRLKACGLTFYLSHYPTLTANGDDGKPLKARVINLCGHTHTPDKWLDWNKGLIYHVELDAHASSPVLIDTVAEEIREHLK